MKNNTVLAAQQRVISRKKAATCPTFRFLKGTDKEAEKAAIENGNHPDPLMTAREWQFQVEHGELKQIA